MKTSTDFARYLSKFLGEFLTYERNLSRNTILAYRDAFMLFIEYMKTSKEISVEQIRLKHITKANVSEFLGWLIAKGNSPSTCNSRLAAIKSFAQYLQYYVVDLLSQWQEIQSIPILKSETKAINYLNIEGVKLVLSLPDANVSSGLRHLAIISLMYDTGARVQEIADLNVNSLRVDYTPYTIQLLGKGRKGRIVPISEKQAEILRNYIKVFRLNEPSLALSPLFFNNKHERLTREGISYIVLKYINAARRISPDLIPDKISCHSLRHSKAMHLMQAGVNFVYIRDILGHASIRTTEIYARADTKAKREALEKAAVQVTPENIKGVWEEDADLRHWLRNYGK
jgi:site-specific recombinase XerD